MKTNRPNRWTETTHEGALASRIQPIDQLRRSVMSCLLWEDEFYEGGVEIATRIRDLVAQVSPEEAASIAIDARERMHLRHVPLAIALSMARLPTHAPLVSFVLERVVMRPDELTETLSLYALGRTERKKLNKLSAQVRKGLARAFRRFDEYQLAKWDRDGAVKLRDVMRLVHPRPRDEAQGEMWGRLLRGELKTPDTWEVAISAAKGPEEKLAAWTRLLVEDRLGTLALLRNLRNLVNAGVPTDAIATALRSVGRSRVLPFRFIAAARHAPLLEPEIEAAMLRSLAGSPKLPGRTVLIVDVSGSMGVKLSDRSEMSGLDAACALAILLREACEMVQVISVSYAARIVPARRGFALRDAIDQSQPHGGTKLDLGVIAASGIGYDRIIMVTDEQSESPIPNPDVRADRAYLINVASARNGIGYGPWTHIDGWSEAVVDYIAQSEGIAEGFQAEE